MVVMTAKVNIIKDEKFTRGRLI